METTQGMAFQWVIGRAIGDRAKSILDNANAGIGYFIMETGRQGNQQTCLYAFRRAADTPIPDHLTEVVDMFQRRKLEDRWNARHGIEHHAAPQKKADPKRVQEIKDIFTKRKISREKA